MRVVRVTCRSWVVFGVWYGVWIIFTARMGVQAARGRRDDRWMSLIDFARSVPGHEREVWGGRVGEREGERAARPFERGEFERDRTGGEMLTTGVKTERSRGTGVELDGG